MFYNKTNLSSLQVIKKLDCVALRPDKLKFGIRNLSSYSRKTLNSLPFLQAKQKHYVLENIIKTLNVEFSKRTTCKQVSHGSLEPAFLFFLCFFSEVLFGSC